MLKITLEVSPTPKIIYVEKTPVREEGLLQPPELTPIGPAKSPDRSPGPIIESTKNDSAEIIDITDSEPATKKPKRESLADKMRKLKEARAKKSEKENLKAVEPSVNVPEKQGENKKPTQKAATLKRLHNKNRSSPKHKTPKELVVDCIISKN